MRADNSSARSQVVPTIQVRFSTVEALCNAAEWNVATLARRMCMDQSTVTRLLEGKTRPGPRSIASLLFAFRGLGEDRGLSELAHLDDEANGRAEIRALLAVVPPFPKVKFDDLFQVVLLPVSLPVSDDEAEAVSA